MRVINRPSKPEVWPKTIVCPNCKCEIEYDDLDLEDIEGGIGFKCPDCNANVVVEEIKLHKYPEAFHSYEGGYDTTDKEIQSYVNRMVDLLEKHKDEENYWNCTATGNTIVLGLNMGDCDKIIVAKNYREEEYNFRD